MLFKQLMEPILEDGIQHINFFNGRLLSGEDLNGERAANQTARRRLGQAIGDGVAFGLEVSNATGSATSSSPPTGRSLPIEVKSGLAINKRGDPLFLPDGVTISLANLPGVSTTTSDSSFEPCHPPEGGEYVAGAGAYVLTIGSVQRGQGRAPVSGLGNSPVGCNVQYNVDGIQFNLIQLTLTAAERDAPQLRNRLAYRCFGAYDPSLTKFVRDPFGLTQSYGLLDDLRHTCLTDDQVPLALIYLTATGGIRFVDMWAVRRRLTRRSATEYWNWLDDDPTQRARRDWAWLIGDRRQSETEAMFLQFEDNMQDILDREPSVVSGLSAVNRFDFLPPVGILRVSAPPSFLRQTPPTAPSGFNPATFFGSRASQDIALTDVALLRSLVREAIDHEPIDLRSNNKIQLYLIYENVRAVEAGLTSNLPLVFASRTLPYRGVARYGYAKYALSRFASQVI